MVLKRISPTKLIVPTIGKSSMRLFITIAASADWTVKTTDIKSAFLQGMTLDRDVFISPPKEADLDGSKIWKLNRCINGLNDGARKFYLSVQEHLLLKCACEQAPTMYMYSTASADYDFPTSLYYVCFSSHVMRKDYFREQVIAK